MGHIHLMRRYTDLSAVLDRIWSQLADAADDPGHPYRRLVFGTVRNKGPRLRTIVLRRVHVEKRRLTFHTDRRSPKAAEVRSNDSTALHGWDPNGREQVRLRGSSTIHEDDAVADDLWSSESPESLAVYPGATAPGTPIDFPSERDSTAERPAQSQVGGAAGREHFAVVRTVVDEIDWLHLHPETHNRAQFRFEHGRATFEGQWVTP